MTTSATEVLPAKPRPRDVARWLGITTVTLWRWRQRNAIPAPVRLGNTRSLFFDRDELLAWEAARREAKP